MDVFDTIDSLVANTQATLGGIITLAGIIVGLTIAVKQRSITGVIIGVVVGGLIAALGALVLWGSGLFETTLTNAAGQLPVAPEQVAVEPAAAQPEALTAA